MEGNRLATRARRAHDDFDSVLEAFRGRASVDYHRPAYIPVEEHEPDLAPLTFGELEGRARAVGAALQLLGQQGDRALLLCPPGIEYSVGLFGCLCGGFAAVPAYAVDVGQQAGRIVDLVADSGSQVGVTTSRMLTQIRGLP